MLLIESLIFHCKWYDNEFKHDNVLNELQYIVQEAYRNKKITEK